MHLYSMAFLQFIDISLVFGVFTIYSYISIIWRSYNLQVHLYYMAFLPFTGTSLHIYSMTFLSFICNIYILWRSYNLKIHLYSMAFVPILSPSYYLLVHLSYVFLTIYRYIFGLWPSLSFIYIVWWCCHLYVHLYSK